MADENILETLREQAKTVRASVKSARTQVRSVAALRVPAIERLPKAGILAGNPGGNPGNPGEGILKLDLLQKVRTMGLRGALSERFPALKGRMPAEGVPAGAGAPTGGTSSGGCDIAGLECEKAKVRSIAGLG